MRVLRGPPEFKPFGVTCSHCLALIEVEAVSDILVSDPDGPNRAYRISCPITGCEMPIRIDANNIPRHMFGNIKPFSK
jgi:hypothetical protein